MIPNVEQVYVCLQLLFTSARKFVVPVLTLSISIHYNVVLIYEDMYNRCTTQLERACKVYLCLSFAAKW